MWSYMKFGPVVQKEIWFKNISFLELWQPPFVQGTGIICAILVEGIMRAIHVKLYEIWTSGSGKDVV